MKYLRASVLFFSIMFGGFAWAETPAEVEAAKLLDTMNMQTTLDQAIDMMLDAQIKQKPELAPFKEVMLAFFAKYMSYEVLKPAMIGIYASEFSAAELKDIREFYSTPTGKKAIEKMPSLMGKGAEMGARSVQEHVPELVAMIEAESARLEKLRQAEAPQAK